MLLLLTSLDKFLSQQTSENISRKPTFLSPFSPFLITLSLSMTINLCSYHIAVEEPATQHSCPKKVMGTLLPLSQWQVHNRKS
jgi:hypothetical protein